MTAQAIQTQKIQSLARFALKTVCLSCGLWRMRSLLVAIRASANQSRKPKDQRIKADRGQRKPGGHRPEKILCPWIAVRLMQWMRSMKAKCWM